MTAAVVETDIDRFIRDQKSKLAHERRALAEDGNRRERSQSPETKRRLWDKSTLGDHRLAEQTNSRSHAGTEHTGLPIGESQNEARRKQLQAERNREYNEMVQKKAVPNRRPPPTPDNMAPRPIPTTDRPDPRGRGAVRQSQNDAPPQLQAEMGEVELCHGILPFDNVRQHIQHRERLKMERQQDFRDYMTKKLLCAKHMPMTPAEAMGLPVGQYEEAKRKLHREITEQYRAMLEQQQEVSEKLHLLQLSQEGEIDLPFIEDGLVFSKHPCTPQPDLNVIGQPSSGACTQREIHNQFRTRYQEMTSYDPILERLSQQEFNRTHHNPWQFSEKRRKEQQLESSLEDIHKREEHLRRSLDEDQIREADQEHTLREERWRRQGVDRAPPKEIEHRPAYFKQGDYERFRERLGEERRKEYNEMISKKIEEKPRYYRAREEERNPDRTYRARHAQYPLDGRQDRGTQKPPAPPNRRIWREPSGDENIGLPIGEYERKKQELAAQRKREMQENISKNQPTSRRQWQEAEHTGLKLTSENPAARFNEEKRRDYNEDISKKPVRNRRWREPSANGAVLFIPEREKAEEQLLREKQKQKQTGESPRRLWREPSSEAGLNLGLYEEKRKAFVEERQRDTERVMAEKTGVKPRRTWQEPSSEAGLNLGQYEEKRKAFIEERQRDTERIMAEKTGEYPRRTWHEPSSGAGLNLGQYEEKRKALVAERQRDTERVMAEKTGEKPRRTWHEPSSEAGLNLGQYEQKRKVFKEERQRDTERVMAEKGTDRKDLESYGPQTKPAYKSSLPLGEYEPIKRKYQEEKYRDYNQRLAEKPPPSNRRIWREPSNDSSIGLDFKKFDWREKYQKRKNEINQRYAKEDEQLESYRSEAPSKTPVYFGSREEEYERLAQTEREYRDLINQLHDRRADLPPKPATPGGFLNRLGRDNGRKEQLGDERRREYNQFMAEKSTRGGAGRRDQGEYSNGIAGLRDANSAKYRYPERPKSDSDVRGSWSKPWFERNRSYVDFKPFSLEKMKKRNEEYNEFLREKGSRRPHTENAKQRHGEYYTTLPGLNYENTKSLQSEYERNREYNEFLRQKAVREMSIRAQAQDVPPDNPRRGWATPTYEEMLQQKRQEEARYRRFDDPEYKRPGMKSYGSEGALNGIDAPRRGKDLDLDLDRRLRLDEGRRSILEDPLWLSPRRAEIYDKEFNSGPPISRLREYNFTEAELSPPDTAKPVADAGKGEKKQYPDPPRHAPAPARHARDPDYYATLPVGDQRERPSRSTDDGQDERMSAQQRKKEQYRHELEKQMQEAAENKRREKLEDLKVSATGAKDPQMRDERPRALGVNAPPPPYIAPPPTQLMGPIPAAPIVAPVPAQAPVYKIVDPTPVYTTRVADYDKLSPRSELVLGRKSLYTGDNQWDQIKQLDRINFDLDRSKYDIPSSNSGGILERGFDALLEPPRVPSIQPPPGLEYKPMTFITGGGVGSLSSVDDAYYLLGQKNPLEPEIVGAAQPRVQAAAPVMAAGAAAAGPSTVPAGRVRFNDEAPRRQPPGGGVTFAEDGNDKAAARAKAQAYQLELAKQIEEAKTKKARAKAEQDWYDMKLEQEAKDYNPYGKGGGGAPMKDDQGNTMADLRAMKKGYQTGAGYSAFSSSPRPPPPRDDMIKTPPSQTTALGDVTHARGGHGIFGMPKTEAEKHQSNVYKDDLQRQIEARKAAAAREREKERYEEEKEMRRIEAERKKMQDEYEEERKKIKAKEDEARRKNEELMRQAEERKREAEQRRRDAEDERRRQQEEADRERLERERATRTASPPIPAVTRKQATEPESTQNAPASPRVKSPPVPAARSKPPGGANSRPSSAANKPEAQPQDRYVPTPQTYRLERGKSPAEPGPSSQRAPSADILNALARMKHQLASERDRVENMLDKNDNEPEVFDARLAQRPPPVPRQHDIDVFERARNRSTVPVRRAPTVNEHPPNPSYLNEFNILKHADTDSRQEFKRHYPYEPMSNDNLEQQQAALIRQQEEGLRAMRDKIQSRMSMAEEEPAAGSSRYEKALPHMDPKDLGLARHQTLSPQPMLHSNSAFIDMNGLGPVFPDDLDDLPRRNDSARQRRRDRLFSSPRPGSVTSLDVDQIARKNEQRLKKLRDMQGDDLSMNDPDDVLDRFVSKQSHHRPPTSQTLQDDSWLQAGSKLSRY